MQASVMIPRSDWLDLSDFGGRFGLDVVSPQAQPPTSQAGLGVTFARRDTLVRLWLVAVSGTGAAVRIRYQHHFTFQAHMSLYLQPFIVCRRRYRPVVIEYTTVFPVYGLDRDTYVLNFARVQVDSRAKLRVRTAPQRRKILLSRSRSPMWFWKVSFSVFDHHFSTESSIPLIHSGLVPNCHREVPQSLHPVKFPRDLLARFKRLFLVL